MARQELCGSSANEDMFRQLAHDASFMRRILELARSLAPASPARFVELHKPFARPRHEAVLGLAGIGYGGGRRLLGPSRGLAVPSRALNVPSRALARTHTPLYTHT